MKMILHNFSYCKLTKFIKASRLLLLKSSVLFQMLQVRLHSRLVRCAPRCRIKLAKVCDQSKLKLALTSLIIKSFEKKNLLPKTKHLLDPLQFAYRSHRGVQDAIIPLLNYIYKHLEGIKIIPHCYL